ncbi:MAG: hypothetical protein M3464_20200 [Chloroflexota bacterium]|nr:hypothetical protein [Chloroflexota bacterium]
MYQLQRGNPTGNVHLTASASTPVELVEAGLRAVLELAREGQGPVTAADGVAVPIRGLGADLPRLFIDLTDDLVSQLEEFGPGFDVLRLDGLLRTETGGYTAWGYLSGGPGESTRVPFALVADSVVVAATAAGLELTGQLRTAAG